MLKKMFAPLMAAAGMAATSALPGHAAEKLAHLSELAVSMTIQADALEMLYVHVNADGVKERAFVDALLALKQQTKELKELAARLTPESGLHADKIENIRILSQEADSRRLIVEVYHRHPKYISEIKRLAAEIFVQASHPADLARGKAFELVREGMEPMVAVPPDEDPTPIQIVTRKKLENAFPEAIRGEELPAAAQRSGGAPEKDLDF